MRNLIVVVVVFLVIGCGNLRHPYQQWPALLVDVKNFSPDEKELVLTYIEDLNQEAGKPLLTLDAVDGYPITISLVPPYTENANRIGYAIVANTDCNIELSDRLFEPGYQSFLESVLWHEIGHCAGLYHDSNHEEVMYHTAAPFNRYTETAIDNFILSLFDSLANL